MVVYKILCVIAALVLAQSSILIDIFLRSPESSLVPRRRSYSRRYNSLSEGRPTFLEALVSEGGISIREMTSNFSSQSHSCSLSQRRAISIGSQQCSRKSGADAFRKIGSSVSTVRSTGLQIKRTTEVSGLSRHSWLLSLE